MAVLNATGLWTEVNYGQKISYASASLEEINISKKDIQRLRNLASRVLWLSETEENKKKGDLWYEHTQLQTTFPVILCDPENGWNEIITLDQIKCSGRLAKRWEVVLLKELFYGQKLKDDKPVEAQFDIGYTYKDSDWVDQEIIHGGKGGGSHIWEAQVSDMEQISNIHFPQIEVDYKATLDAYQLAQEVFEGILRVRLKGLWWWSFGLTYDLVRIVGLENMMLYLYDKPKLIHRIM